MRLTYRFTQQTCEVHTSVVEVPAGCDIHITLLNGPFEHFFLLVKDPTKRLRALFTWKSRIQHYCLRQVISDEANLTVPGPIAGGEWQFTVVKPGTLLGEAAIDINCVPATITGSGKPQIDVLNQPFDSVVNPQRRWYHGDLHAHTLYSDGRVALDDVLHVAQQRQMDFLAITDHSIVTTFVPDCRPLIIPATELTFDNELHYNVFGVKQLIDYSQYCEVGINVTDFISRLHTDLARAGNVISINHPFAEGISLGHEFDLRSVHLLEVINAPHLADQPIDNEKAIRFFDFLWSKGLKIFASGGSDAHKPGAQGSYPLGLPRVSIYCEGLCLDALLQGLRSGRTLISHNVTCALNMLHNGVSVFPGSRVSGPVTFQAECTERPLTWRMIRNGECIHELYCQSYDYTVVPGVADVVRLEAREGGRTVFFANPVYSALPTASEYRFSVLLCDFLAQDSARAR